MPETPPPESRPLSALSDAEVILALANRLERNPRLAEHLADAVAQALGKGGHR